MNRTSFALFQILSRPSLSKNIGKNSRSFHVTRYCFDTFTTTDAVMPQPEKTKLFSYLGATIAISLGLTAGALISKNIASFLEENDLFVPSDDDDDD